MDKNPRHWFNVKIYLKGVQNPLVISMTESELTTLKNIKTSGTHYYFETTHKCSDRLLIDVTNIVAICESEEQGED